MRIERYESIPSYLATVDRYYQQHKPRNNPYSFYGYNTEYGGGSQGESWDAGVGYKEATRRSIDGDPSLVSKYVDTVDKLVQDYKVGENVRRSYNPSFAGSRVSIPDYLASSPHCMRRKTAREITTRTVNIYVCTTCHAYLKADQMIKRGSTILALLEYLNMSQVGVELYLMAETHGKTDGDFIQVIKVESHPLDLSTAGFAIAHPAFARQVTYALAQWQDGFNGMFASSFSRLGEKNYEAKLRKEVGMQEGDIYIPMPGAWQQKMMETPEKWLESYIRNIKGQDDEAV